MSNIVIPIDSAANDFNNYLNTDSNLRIFFSGRFGIGKTYFLQNFFNEYKKDYDVYHLYPVNYQINSNENIIDLIKYDILIELLSKNPNILDENTVGNIKESAFLFYSWYKKYLSINDFLKSSISVGESMLDLSGDPLMLALGKLGKPLKSVLNLDKEFQAFKKDYLRGEKGVAEKFIETLESKDIIEDDYFSNLLSEKINKQKSDKKSVLILDDLDRIDPEHIFRILNIFSAHFEKEHSNKFGFDMVIIVADYSNIKNIFHHKYGLQTDFTGYLDKFFSISPYYYDNKKAVMAVVDDIVKSIKHEEPYYSAAIGDGGYIKLFLSYIFSKSVDHELINLRELFKATRFQLPVLKKGSYKNDYYFDKFLLIFDVAINVCIQSFSNTEVFIEKLKILKTISDENDRVLPYGKYLQAMLNAFGHKIPETPQGALEYKTYEIRKGGMAKGGVDVVDNLDEALFYDLLIDYIQNKKHINKNYRIND